MDQGDARGRPPDFLIVGAQRSGTASLFDALVSHPLVAPPTTREVHYFDLRYWRGRRWYHRQFRRPADRLSGESSPYYLFHPRVPERVASDLPQVRIVALVRHPIERAWSHHQFNLRTGREDLPFLEALAAEPERMAGRQAPWLPRRRLGHRDHSYAARGRYPTQLRRWAAAVGPQRMLVVGSAELFDRPGSAHARVLAHLGLPSHELSTPHRHGGGAVLDAGTRAEAARFFPHLDRDLDELRTRWGVDYG